MTSAGGVQSYQHATIASVTEIEAQDQFEHQYHDDQRQGHAPSQERVQAANHEYLSGMRESLFRLLSKVPIQIDTVRPTATIGYSAAATAAPPAAAPSAAPRDQQNRQLEVPANAQRKRQPSDHLRDPLVIKYYQQKSLANIIELHFACSLISDKHHHDHGRQTVAGKLSHATDYPNQQHSQYHHQLVAPGPMTVLRPAMNGLAVKSTDRKLAASRSLPSQRATSNKSQQRDKFNGQTKGAAANGAGRHLKYTIQQQRALRLQQQQQQSTLLQATRHMVDANGEHVRGVGGATRAPDAMPSYRLAGSNSTRSCHSTHRPEQLTTIPACGKSVPSSSCATTIAYDGGHTTAACQQDQFVFVGSAGACGQPIAAATPAGMLDASQHVQLYAPPTQIDYNQQYHYGQFPTHPSGEGQQQFGPYGAHVMHSDPSGLQEYHSHAVHPIHCDSQHPAHQVHQVHQVQQQQPAGCELAWHPHNQVHPQHSEQFSAGHDQAQCGAPQQIDHQQQHQHTFIHFNVTDLNQMIEQQQQQQQQQQQPYGSELQVVCKSEYFHKHPTSYSVSGHTTPLADTQNMMPRNQLNKYHNPQAPATATTPLHDGQPAHVRQGASSLDSSSSSCSSSSSSSSSCASASTSLSINSSVSRTANGPTTPLVDTNAAPAHLNDCLHLEPINSRPHALTETGPRLS